MNQHTDSQRPVAAPQSKTLVSTRGADADARSQTAQVPIDEVQALGIKVSPTYGLDDIQSVTLKSFRKVIGYDTFDSILKKERNEKKRKPFELPTLPEIKGNTKKTMENKGNLCIPDGSLR